MKIGHFNFKQLFRNFQQFWPVPANFGQFVKGDKQFVKGDGQFDKGADDLKLLSKFAVFYLLVTTKKY